jgi:hypothetical protein
MQMTFIRAFVFSILFLFVAIDSQAISAIHSIEELREKNDKREYHFYINDSLVGKMQSVYGGNIAFDDVPGFIFYEILSLDFSPIGRDYKFQIQNRHYVGASGSYIGDDMLITSGGAPQRLYMKNYGGNLIGYSDDNVQKQDIFQPLSENIFAVDINMIDQLEILMGFHDINVGDTIYDSVFVPQSQSSTSIKAFIEKYDYVRYNKMYDSAFVCHFIEPFEQIVYITKDRKIIKLEQPTQNLVVELQESPLDKMAPKKRAFTFTDFIKRLPIFIVYLIFGIIFSSPFLMQSYKRPEIYIAFIIGGAAFLLNNLLTFPMQKWYGTEILIPAMEQGGSLYFYGFFTTLISGFMQETIKLIPIILIFLWKKPTQKLSIAIGSICGIGYGIYAACSSTGGAFQIGAMEIMSATVFGQVIAILFHGAIGAAFGYAINRGWKHLAKYWLILIVVHAFSDYLLVFHQKGGIDMALLEMSRAIICLLTVLIVYLMIKQAQKRIGG